MAGGGGNDDVQCYVAIDMMNRLLDDKTPGKDERKALITGFTRLYIPETTPLEQLKELFELVDEYVSEGDISEAYAKNAMQRFYNEIKGAIERAEQLLAAKPDEKEEEELVLIHSASENPKEDKEKDSKEAFETPSEESTEKVVTEDGTDPDRLSLVAESVAEVEAEEDNDIENVVANGDLEDNEKSKLEQPAPEAETSESEDEDISIQDNKNETYEDQDEKEDDDDELIPQVKKTSRSSRTTRSSRSTSQFSSRTKAEATEEDSKDRTTPNSKTSKDKLLLKRKSVSKSNDKSKSRSSKSSKTSKNAKYERPGKRQRTSGTKQDIPIEIDDSVGDSN